VVADSLQWFTQDIHGATSQKMAFFIVTAVKTSNLTSYLYIQAGEKFM
jgi:hypothetical protein